MDAASELPQLVQRRLQLGLSFAEQLRVGVGVAQELQCEADREQPLLRTVVQVALESSSFRVAGGDDPGSRFPQLGQLGAQLGVQAHVLEREPRGRPGGLEQRPLADEPRVVDERCYWLLLGPDQCDGAVWRSRCPASRRRLVHLRTDRGPAATARAGALDRRLRAQVLFGSGRDPPPRARRSDRRAGRAVGGSSRSRRRSPRARPACSGCRSNRASRTPGSSRSALRRGAR